MVKEINESNFETEVLDCKKPVVLDFWATWCGPCQMIAPILEKLSTDFEDKIKFTKINIEFNENLAKEFKVSGIPCLVVFKDGKEINRFIGYLEEDELKEKLNKVIS